VPEAAYARLLTVCPAAHRAPQASVGACPHDAGSLGVGCSECRLDEESGPPLARASAPSLGKGVAVSTTTPAWLPSTSTARCPVCGAVYDTTAPDRCPGCRIDLTHPAVPRLQDVNDRIWTLQAERNVLVAALEETRAEPAGTTSPPPAWTPPAAAGRTPAPPRPGPARAPVPMPTLLALAGGALLTAAAVVFVAVTWETLPAWAQAAVLLAATVLAGTTAIVLHRRDLPTAAAAVGLVTMAFAAVDIVAIDRGGLLTLGDFLPSLAATAAAAAGWLLERRGLRWTGLAGALAVLVAANGFLVATIEATAWPIWTEPLLATAAALVVGATALAWQDHAARMVALAVAALGLFAAGGSAAATVAGTSPVVPLLPAVLIVGLPIALYLAAARWADWALAPATLLVLAGTLAFGYRGIDAEVWPLLPGIIAGAATTVAVWLALRLTAPRRLGVLVGAALPLAALALAAGAAVTLSLARLAERVAPAYLEEEFGTDPWLLAFPILLAAAALAVPRVRPHLPWVVAALLVAAPIALPADVTWPLLLAGAVVATILAAPPPRLATSHRPDVSVDPVIALPLAVLAIGWAADRPGTLLVAAAVTAALAGWLTWHADDVRRRLALTVGVPAAALAVAVAVDTAGGALVVTLGAALLTVFVVSAVLLHLDVEVPPVVTLAVAGAATVGLPMLAATARHVGVLLLLAAAGWLVVAVIGPRHARWASAVVASVGNAVLLADAGVEVVEAYTVVPAVLLGAAGVWWLVEDRELPTLPALLPALAVALLPSLLTLSNDPRHLARTLGLTAAAAVLAAVGVRGRWFAPTLAGVITAGWVALTQLWIVAEVLPRWVTFAVVGVLLVFLAATYERQQQRARALVRRFDRLR
jgi:hypothetical protein